MNATPIAAPAVEATEKPEIKSSLKKDKKSKKE
jgi:hypothetical protein